MQLQLRTLRSSIGKVLAEELRVFSMQYADASGLFSHTWGRPPQFVDALIHITTVLVVSNPQHTAVLESIMTQPTIVYLERRYADLENQIENALERGPTDHMAVADLIYRKLIVAEEIKHNRRLVELVTRTQN